VHHIGSTFLPGLAAKPIINLLSLARTIAAIDDRTPWLREAGYRDLGECGLTGRRHFTRDRGEVRTHDVHIYESDDAAVEHRPAFWAT
jgi:GrpB-like predicted nucleotidyltransferase (UPF0157 family)